MYKVSVMNACKCFLRSGFAEEQEHDTTEEAKKSAEKLLGEMKDKFCKKHDFVLNEQFGDYTIFIRPR